MYWAVAFEKSQGFEIAGNERNRSDVARKLMNYGVCERNMGN